MIIIIIFVVTLALGVPVAVVLGLTSILPVQMNNQLTDLLIPQSLFNGMYSIVLIAISGFIFAGFLMEKAGITDGILEFARVVVGRLPGGYAIMCVVASAFFAALTGAGPACTAAIGSLTIPLMLGAGYDVGFTSGVAATGGSLGVMIPPSNPMILYALLAGVSVGDMFLAGIVPGIMMAIMLSILCVFIAKKRGYVGAPEKFTFKQLLIAIWHAKWGICAPIIILGSIYTGIATPTEASILACVYSLLIGLFSRKLKFKDITSALKKTAMMSGSIVILVAVSTAFARVLTVMQVPQTVAMAFTAITTNKYILQILILLLMTFIGMWLDPLAAIIIVTPIFLPMIEELGVSTISFGILLVVTSQLAMITPPVAGNLFVVAKIARTSLVEVSRNIIPFMLALLLAGLIIIFVPDICLLFLN